jgi:L-alanine-DL-glutamate epimerase-like enolase superfamily enzyme
MHDLATAAEVLVGADLGQYRLSARKLAEALPQGKSACTGVEIAMLDAYCKSLGIPVYALFGGAPIRIETDVTIPICPPDHARERAKEMGSKGFRLFKVKVGKEREEDLARVIAIAEGAPGCSFVLDANQGYTASQAVRFTRAVLDRGLSVRLLEQPVDAADLNGLRYVTERVAVPVFADESAQTPADVLEVVRYRAANGVNVKLMKAGVIGALTISSICRAAKMDLMFGCMLESRIGQAASVHVACGTNTFSVFDLDSDLLIESQPIKGGVTRRGPVVKLAGGPGLGCKIGEGALEPFLKRD